MTRFDGSAALTLDFGGVVGVTTTGAMSSRAPGLRLAAPTGGLRGPDKYRVLEHRRRQAQIKARHLLELMEEAR
ncbi:MAG: hypothetical protein H0W08_12145 [Acidobacteria bacterium]|nr:hypothetical protein [Acidobacteriota bacterium]